MGHQATVVIVGATATGKSDLAAAVAARVGGEVVNADALQVYRRLEIGTGKPPAVVRGALPHHLFDLLEPQVRASAGWYARAAGACLAAIRERGRLALVVGGTGFYLEALFGGLAEVPPVAAELELALRESLERRGVAALRRELEVLDPAWAARVAPSDRQRILRGLAVAWGSGRRLSDWHRQRSAPVVTEPAVWFGLTLPRPELRARIARRVDAMLAAGWVEEVAALLAAGFEPAAPAFQAIGYRDVVRHLAGGLSRSELRDAVVLATCQYAKRQETWFRRRAEVAWLDARAPLEQRVEQVLARVGSIGGSG